MGLTILEMVQKAERELGLPVSSSVFSGSSDDTGRQMAELGNRVLDELRRMNRWTALQWEFNLVVDVPITTTGNMVAGSAVITNIPSTTGLEAYTWAVQSEGVLQAARILSVDSATQVTMTMENINTENVTGATVIFAKDTYAMPSGFDWFNNDTMWDRTNRWRLIGPDSPQQDQFQRSGVIATGPRRHFRKIGPYSTGSFRVWPAPVEITEPLQLVYEYLSINAVVTATTVNNTFPTYAQYFTSDGDECILDENAIITGIKWMFWEVKGFGSYVTLQGRWVDYVHRLIARDGAASALNVVRVPKPYYLSSNNVQDGNFPGPDSSGS